MTTSPYDSLPSGNNDIFPEEPKIKPVEYKEIDLEQIKAVPPKAPLPTKPIKTKPLSTPPHYIESSLKNFLGCDEYILPFEETLLVPDTMADMRDVLFAEGRVDISPIGKSTYDRNDFLSGNITIFTVYKPTDVVKSIIPFRTDKCWDHAEGDSFRVSATLKSVDAEMINERKFTVKGELLIKIFEVCEHKLMHYSDSADTDIMTCKKPLQATVLDQELSDTTEISQEITTKEGSPLPDKILKTTINIVENHRQITSGKLILNASIHYQILYLGEKETGGHELSCLGGKTDFSQFILIRDDADTELLKINFRNDLDVVIEDNKGFLLRGNVTTLVQSYDNKTIESVCDAYHKREELLFDTKKTPLVSVADVVSGEISGREVVNMAEDDKKPAVLLCGDCLIESLDVLIKHGQIIINGTLKANILALDDENSPFVIHHKIPVKGTLDMSVRNSVEPSLYVDAVIKDFWFSEINSRQIEINTSLAITTWAITKETFCTIENLRFADSELPAAGPSMAIYVVAPGESLWDVAKRYKCDISHLAELNDLDPEKPVLAGTKLFCQKNV